MSLAAGPSATLGDRPRLVLPRILQKQPVVVLERLIEAWDVLSRLLDKIRYRGLYEILDCDATFEILDPVGKKAVLTRREVVCFLQDNVVAIHDHAWGDGELFAEYRCQPGLSRWITTEKAAYLALRCALRAGLRWWLGSGLTRGACGGYNLPQVVLANTQPLIEAQGHRRWLWQSDTPTGEIGKRLFCSCVVCRAERMVVNPTMVGSLRTVAGVEMHGFA